MVDRPDTGLLGAGSMVGEGVVPLLVRDGRHVYAFSRKTSDRKTEAGVTRLQLDVLSPTHPATPQIKDWLCVAPVWV